MLLAHVCRPSSPALHKRLLLPHAEILDACEDVKAGLDHSNSASIARVVKWATEEALYKVNATHPGEFDQQRENGPAMPGGHPCQRPWPPPREELESDFIACVNRCMLHVWCRALK